MEKHKALALIDLLNTSILSFEDLKSYLQFREKQIPSLEKLLTEQLFLSAQDRSPILKVRTNLSEQALSPETFILSGYDPVIKTVFIHRPDRDFIFHEAVEIDRFILGEYIMEPSAESRT